MKLFSERSAFNVFVRMKAKIIIFTIILSAAIWFGIGWLIDLFGFNDYGFIRSIVIVVVVYFAVEIIKEIDND